MRIDKNITGTGNTFLCHVAKPRHADNWAGTFIASGTFGGTTLTLGISVDGGTTVVPLDTSVFSATSNAATSIPVLGSDNTLAENVGLYAIATGGSGIDIDATVLDNR